MRYGLMEIWVGKKGWNRVRDDQGGIYEGCRRQGEKTESREKCKE